MTGRAFRRGFTLVEMIVGLTLAAMVSAAVLSAFVFMGRNLARLVNNQYLEERSRRAFYLFNQDIGEAAKLTAASDTGFTATTSSGGTVTYAFSGSTLTRNTGTGAQTILTDLTAFDFNFYNTSGNSITNLVSIKEVQFTFTMSVSGISATGVSGAAASGTTVTYSGVSPRSILRNTTLLQ